MGDFGLWLTLVQLRPGAETRVNERFSHSFPEAGRYKCFGKFDYMVLREFRSFEQMHDLDRDLLDLSSDILHVNHVICYGLDNPESLVPSSGPLRHEPFVTTTFLKLRHGLLQRSGMGLISALNGYLGDIKPRLRSGYQSLYGCLGWNELVLLTWGRDLADIVEDVLVVSNIRGRDIGLPQDDGIFVDSFSIPAMSFECVEKLLAGDNLQHLGVRETQNVSVSLSISCATGVSHERVAQRIRTHFDDVDLMVLYGKDDILVRPRALLSLKFLRGLLQLRDDQQIKDDLFATCTVLAVPNMANSKKMPEKGAAEGSRPSFERVEICDSIRQLRREDYPLFKSISDIFCSMNAYFSDPVLCDAFLDMVPFLKRLSCEPEEEVLAMADLWQTVNLFSKGFKQRFVGSSVTLFNVTELVLAYQGGLQRVNLAADLIPVMLLKSVGHQWYGFSVFGVKNQYMRYDFGVINLPFECLFEPGRWFGVFHEVGHDLAHKKELLESAKQLLQNTGIEHLADPTNITFEDIGDMKSALETYSDLFDFVCGFRGDWKCYAERVLVYVFSKIPEHDPSLYRAYFRRTFMIFCYCKLGREKAFGDAYIEAFMEQRRKLVDELHAEVKKAVTSAESLPAFDAPFIQDVYLHYNKWRKFTEWAASDIESSRLPVTNGWRERCQTVLDDLKRGIVRDDFDDPCGLLLTMPKEDNNLKLVLAVILSFSSYYSMHCAPKDLPVFTYPPGPLPETGL